MGLQAGLQFTGRAQQVQAALQAEKSRIYELNSVIRHRWYNVNEEMQ